MSQTVKNSHLYARPRKRFAQHWLNSDRILEQIITAARLTATDNILEIGPGTGILTRRLLPEVNSLIAVEIDRDLCQKLTRNLGNTTNFLLLEADILNLDLAQILQTQTKFKYPNKVVANIPYNITGLILEKLLGSISQPISRKYDSIVLLIQKEVGDRIIASPSTKAYGALSVRMQYLARCELICHVPPKAFYPPPKVASTVVRLSPHNLKNPAKNPRQLETLIKLGFANRRKMLRNNWKSIIEPDNFNDLLENLNIDPQSRAENLSLENWIDLSNNIQINSNLEN
jgi:16S rRNA (adenine1518-N6/adenine1519-N6)-dimethyltransferase